MSTSFSLSLELVLLMGWLLKHEKKTLKKIINQSLEAGLLKEIELVDTFSKEELLDMNSDFSQELHNSILDFLVFLEDILIEGLEIKDTKEEQDFTPTIQKINNQKLDNKTVLLSLKKTNNQIDNAKNKSNSKKQEQLKDILFSELLKNWMPKTNEPIN
ncbi:hypothetical protein GF385_02800 [Candidatus Dependentiae bacterium]|nr:hypothetical protein [Candidatus Dependentiae bacterium]